MIWIKIDCNFELFDCLLVFLELVEDFAEAKVSRYRLRIKFAAMFEVFFSFLEVSGVGKLSSQVNAGAEVGLVGEENLLEVIDRLLQLLLPFILAAKVKM